MNRLDGNRIHDLQRLGQSVWLDELHRSLFQGSQFKKLVNDGVVGVTSNPSIFAHAFAEDQTYRDAIAALRKRGASGRQIYEQLSCEDICSAADQLRRVYDQSGRRDGYVSIEVSPDNANDADATVKEAEQLCHRIDRPNVMIKVPATDQGVIAIRRLIESGINVNATLVFGTQRYRQVADAYLQGLEARVADSRPLDTVASVVSLFVSRIDSLVDKQLDEIQHPARIARAQHIRGKAAIAVARFVYQEFKGILASHRWQALAARHALPQRLLWASTRTKDSSFSDVKYVDELVGKDTINTMPMVTLNAFRDHGSPAPALETNLFAVASLPAELQGLGIDLEAVSRQLESEGVASFTQSMRGLVSQLSRPNS